ncbi:DNA methyltransferase [Actinoplanes sp. NPDC051475]|uniref:TRM11 family SAM-dependent methyltransferase n=1 Tax=Actinoplanes sp. NPDC051475 TaxID=3157225 RepID=UPI00344BB07A
MCEQPDITNCPSHTPPTASAGGRHRDDGPAGRHHAEPQTGDGYTGRHRPSAHELSVWLTSQRTQPVQRRGRYEAKSVAHPARMVPDIAAGLIGAFTEPGDLVIDPMCGIGTTMVEAMHAGRDGLGIEYESQWADLADANIALALSQGAAGRGSVIRGDATRMTSLLPAALHGQAALVITSPPYGPNVHGKVRPDEDGVHKSDAKYGTDKGNLAYRPGGLAALIDGFTTILAGCQSLLRPGGIIAVTVRPYRIGDVLIDLPSAVVGAGVSLGLTSVARLECSMAGLRDGRFIARPSFFQLRATRRAISNGTPALLPAHEDLIILGKPLHSEIGDAHPDDGAGPKVGR